MRMSFAARFPSWFMAAAGFGIAWGLLVSAQAADPQPTKASKKQAEAKAPAAKKADAKKAAAKPAAKRPLSEADVPYPPELPGGKQMVSDTSPEFLKVTADLKEGVTVAKAVPTVDFMYYPNQNYPGKPWSNWGDSV